MSGFTKFAKKVFPRIGCLILALLIGLACTVTNYWFFEPKADVEAEFDININIIKLILKDVFVYDKDGNVINDFVFRDGKTEDILYMKNNRFMGYVFDKDGNRLYYSDILKYVTGEKEESNTPIEGSDQIYNFLVMGHDRAASLTDVIMLISYNLEHQSITIMQIPRDTYIEVNDYSYHKINGLYNYCRNEVKAEGSKNPELDGCTRMADFLEKNLAVKIHYSAVMDLDGFGNIVDAIGGVDMYVPMRMYYPDPEQNLLINLYEGYQHLDGDKAEQFVRYRYGYANADIGRGDAQKNFMAAFLKKLSSKMTDVSVVTSLASNIINYVDTDLPLEMLVYLGKQFIGIGNPTGKAVNLSNVKFLTMPGQAAWLNRSSYYVMNREYMTDIIDEYYNIYNVTMLWSFDQNEIFVTEEDTDIRDIYFKDKDKIALVIQNAGALNEDENG